MATSSYKRHSPRGTFDAIVVGSGIGGLTTASLLSRFAGQRVLVLERHYTAGGYTHEFKRPGYAWDVGVHYIGGIRAPEPVGALFDIVTGGKVRWQSLPECYDRMIIGDESFDFVAGRRRFIETLHRTFPSERRSIERFVSLIHRSVQSTVPYFAGHLLPASAGRWTAPWAGRAFHHYADRSVEQVLRPHVRDPKLFDVLTGQCLDYGLTPSEGSFAIQAMVSAHYLSGAYYPIGGPGTIAEGAEEVIARAGGAIFTNAEVEEILVEENRAVGVRVADGAELRAPVVISNAGAASTYLRLLPSETAEATGWPQKLREVGPSVAHLCLHVGLDGSHASLGLDGTNLWVYAPGDREANFRAFAHTPDAPLPVIYISFPSAKDPSWSARHPGRATVELITVAQMKWFRRWADTRWMRRDDDYAAWKSSMTERMLTVLYAQRPQLRGKVVHAELSTPLSTAHFMGHPGGEMYGLAHTPERFRLEIRPETPIAGLWLTGSDVATCGVAGAMLGGFLTAGALAPRAALTWLRSLGWKGSSLKAALE